MIIKLKFNSEQVDRVAKEQVIPLLKNYSIFTLTGPLGAGKTTLIKSIFRQCGVAGGVTSPTFGYVNSYSVANDMTLNHFDLYRIASVEEFISLGFDEYFYKKNSVSFIEWPDVIASLLASNELKQKVCEIKIDYIADDISSRVITIKF